MSLAAIRQGMADNLNTIDGLRVVSYFPDDIAPPMAIVDRVSIAFDSAFNRGSDEITVDVIVVVRRISERSAQEALDAYAPLIKQAIESDDTLGGAAQSLIVTSMDRYSELTIGETSYLASTYAVRVIATA